MILLICTTHKEEGNEDLLAFFKDSFRLAIEENDCMIRQRLFTGTAFVLLADSTDK
jgi:hypothetical protein